jgi:hypothetical protein
VGFSQQERGRAGQVSVVAHPRALHQTLPQSLDPARGGWPLRSTFCGFIFQTKTGVARGFRAIYLFLFNFGLPT